MTVAVLPPKSRLSGLPRAVLLRCALYLIPLCVAVSAAGVLGRVPWLVPVAVLLIGWSAAQGLTTVAAPVTWRYGAAAGARLAGAGFLGAGLAWAAVIWVAPAALLGGDRWLAAGIGAGGLGALAVVTGAVVIRAEKAVLLWSLPCLALLPVRNGQLLLAALAVALARAFWPALTGRPHRHRAPGAGRIRDGLAMLAVGAGQVLTAALVWHAGSGPLAMLPLLASVPLIETLVGWHVSKVEAGPAPAGVDLMTVTGLLPPLAIGATLAITAYAPPVALPALPGMRDGLLGLASGTLLAGIFAATFLLAARGRTRAAAVLAVTPPAVVVLAPLLPRLPLLVVVLTTALFAGLLAVAHTAADQRRTL